MAERLTIDFDDTTIAVRVWRGAQVVGELRPSSTSTPPEERGDMRWQGWLSGSAMTEITAAYKTLNIITQEAGK